ncbi:hypothetical protein PALA111701_27700 [Paenibacillus lactis]
MLLGYIKLMDKMSRSLATSGDAQKEKVVCWTFSFTSFHPISILLLLSRTLRDSPISLKCIGNLTPIVSLIEDEFIDLIHIRLL